MRATRAYVAGFGTAGSLLAAAAVVFVLASALVAFRGWPQLSTLSSPAAVVVARAPAPSDSRLAGRVKIAVAATAPSTVVAATGAGVSATPSRLASGPVLVTTTAPQSVRTPTISGPPVTTPKPIGSHPCTDCATQGVTSTLTSTVTQAAGSAGAAVSSAGHTLGSGVSNATSALATKAAPISPTVAAAVAGTGALLGSTVDKTAAALGGIVAGTGQKLADTLNALTRGP
jgi:hypothetical protein